MTALYSRFAARAADLLAKYGKSVTLTRAAGGTQAVKGLEEAYSDKAIDGTLIKAGDVMLHLAPTDTSGAAVAPPKPTVDRIAMGGKTWVIVRVMPVQPADHLVMTTLQLRA